MYVDWRRIKIKFFSIPGEYSGLSNKSVLRELFLSGQKEIRQVESAATFSNFIVQILTSCLDFMPRHFIFENIKIHL
jgi:hypothetical protein